MGSSILFIPLLLPLLCAVLCIGSWNTVVVQRWIYLTGSVLMVVAAIALLAAVVDKGMITAQAGNWVAPVGITFACDYFSAIMVLISSAVCFALVFYVKDNLDAERKSFGFYPMAMLLMFGVTGSFLTGDVFNLYVWFEVMLMASFVLLTLGGEKAQLEGAIKYVALNFLASALFLAGIGILYGTAGTLNMADLAVKLPMVENQGLVTLAAVFFIICFGIKAAMFPLYFWLPASYHTPPVTITALIAGLITKVGVYALIRFFTLLFTTDTDFTHTVLLYAAVCTMVFGVLGAIVQVEYRKLLSFHIISQIGYMILGLALFTPLAIAGAILFILHNILVKTNLFLVAGISHIISGSYQLKDLGGVYKRFPFVALLFAISAFSLVGIPPLSGFWGKFMFAGAALSISSYGSVVAVVGVSMLTLYSMTKIWGEAFLKEETVLPAYTDSKNLVSQNKGVFFSISFFTLLIIAMGIYPGPLIAFCSKAAEQLMDKQIYIQAVFGKNS
jgi:multicomponent Na+:H+ antiporter subunit D